MSNDKLTETFNLPESEEALMEELEEKYNFSSNPDLDEIAKLALTAYKDQMMDIMCLEPKFRSRALEVANQYLSLAKDALSKAEDLKLKKEKQDKDKSPAEGEEGDDGRIDRNDFMIHAVKNASKT